MPSDMKSEKCDPVSEEEKLEVTGELTVIPIGTFPLTGSPESPTGSLVVKISSRYPWHGEMPNTIDDKLPEAKPYEDPVKVTVEGTDATSAFGDSKYTDKNGQISWNQIAVGKNYQIALTAPEGFRLASYSIAKGDESAKLTECPERPQLITAIEVCDEETTTVELSLVPFLSAVDVISFYDKRRDGDPTGQAPIAGLKASFWKQNKTVVAHQLGDWMRRLNFNDSASEHIRYLLGPSLSRTLSSLPDASRVYVFWENGPVSVRADAVVQVGNKSKKEVVTLQAALLNGTLIAPTAGALNFAKLPYVESQAEVQVSAIFEEDVVCDPGSASANGSSAKKKTPLPGVTFQLYQGSAQGEPSQQATTVGSAPHVFSNLQAGNYAVVASSYPTSFSGYSQIQPIWPSGGTLGSVTLTAGVPTPLVFRFGPSLGRIIGIVTEIQGGACIPGVPLTLAPSGDASARTYKATSDSKGEYSFNNVAAGNYVVRIEKEKINISGGRTLEIPAPAQAGYAVSVTAGGTISVPAIQLGEDIHQIYGTAKASDGSVLQYLRVEIQDKAGNTVAVTQTDGTGYYSCLVPQAGFYLVRPQLEKPQQIPVQVNSVVEVNITASPSGTPASQVASRAGQVQESEIDIQAYPVLTEEVPSEVVSRPISTGGGGTGIAPIGKMAENAIRDVLSWRAKTDDPKSFVLALNQSFALSDVEGHTEFKWTPRTYTVQTDMGAITGAQASIYNRAKVALDQSLPLLDGLYALLPVLEQEDLDSTRDMVKSLFTELVNDLGIEGGPRIPRVDQLFRLLLGYPVPTNPEGAHRESQLGILRQRFNLKREFITTIADEQNLTNYLIVVDYMIGLNNSWINEKKYFAHSGTAAQPYFGTQLVLLSRSLEVVTQAVKDVEFAMDSVFLGAAERQTILLDFTSIGPEASLFVAELLDWVERAASNELPNQLQDSGKDAISTMKHVVWDLHRFVHAAMIPQQTGKGLPPGYRTPRVQRALRLLAEALRETHRLADQIRPPDFPVETGRIPSALV
jgi:hypothetical protein